MAFNPFIGQTEQWLVEKLRETQEELAGGKSTIGGNMGEVGFSKIMTIGPMQRLQMILAALNLLNPTAYPIDSSSVPRSTVGTFSGFR